MKDVEIQPYGTPDGQTTPLNDPPPAAPVPAVCSMTGYAHVSEDTPIGRIGIEIRAVNSRFTDLHFRLADEFRPLEPALRAAINRVVRRGKVECRMTLQKARGDSGMTVDAERLAALVGLARQVQALAPGAAPPTVADYLRWLHNPDHAPGGHTEHAGSPPADISELWALAEPMVAQCLEAFQASRRAEGARLATVLRTLAAEMQALGQKLRACLPELTAAAESRLLSRLSAALQDLPTPIPADETLARVRQEVSLLSLRDDITEELDRLDTHLQAIGDTLAAGGPVGKRLDFLSQELNREANTIASKSVALATTDTALALKLLIEQQREQVQNLE
ncbi:MAG: YicC/YloC family endoribonuclease [Lautropia sp.]|nr:YicC/YloC family endoribonuclease [Lautropia sp.]